MAQRPILRIFSIAAICLAGLSVSATADACGAYGYGAWGIGGGLRVCDATNADGICIAWHSTLRGVDARQFANCTPWHCDLRPATRVARHVAYEPMQDTPPAAEAEPVTPLIIDLKPFKEAKIPGVR